ncbi:unnamed protein product [Symbiodinium natans]|uniref:Uncharacterized protein n=1 Tax=Symbiodinium natans TaxID=878477 RepID=A0A812RS11_9DINO|nr:unnamed protein product [Symbiodinium natans]
MADQMQLDEATGYSVQCTDFRRFQGFERAAAALQMDNEIFEPLNQFDDDLKDPLVFLGSSSCGAGRFAGCSSIGVNLCVRHLSKRHKCSKAQNKVTASSKI